MPKPEMQFVAKATTKRKGSVWRRRPALSIKYGGAQQRELWPSGRGTQVGHFTFGFPALVRLVAARLSKDITAERFGLPKDDFREIVLYDFHGETAVTLLTEPSQAPDVVAIIADAQSDHKSLLAALQTFLGSAVNVVADPPETKGRGAST